MKKSSLIYWKCGICGSNHTSNSTYRHQMDVCDCGKSAVDAEEHYTRTMGEVIYITEDEFKPCA
jgi:hypothetical protein